MTSAISPQTNEALRLLASAIRVHRLRRNWSIDELDEDPIARSRQQQHLITELSLLPRAARAPRSQVDDDF